MKKSVRTKLDGKHLRIWAEGEEMEIEPLTWRYSGAGDLVLHQGRKEEGIKILRELRQEIDEALTELEPKAVNTYNCTTSNAGYVNSYTGISSNLYNGSISYVTGPKVSNPDHLPKPEATLDPDPCIECGRSCKHKESCETYSDWLHRQPRLAADEPGHFCFECKSHEWMDADKEPCNTCLERHGERGWDHPLFEPRPQAEPKCTYVMQAFDINDARKQARQKARADHLGMYLAINSTRKDFSDGHRPGADGRYKFIVSGQLLIEPPKSGNFRSKEEK